MRGIFLLTTALLLAFSPAAFSQIGIINTIAGTGVAGSGGDGGNALLAQLQFPTGIAVGNHGFVYIADANNKSIRVLYPVSGNIFTFSTFFNLPKGVAADTSGNLYVADIGRNIIRKVNASGVHTFFAGTGGIGDMGDGGPATNARFDSPEDVAIAADGTVYVADRDNHKIRKITADGYISTLAGTGAPGHISDGAAATAAMLNMPSGVAVDGAGNVYIADNGNNRIKMVKTDGTMSTIAGNGVGAYGGDGGPATAAMLYNPSGVAVDNRGNVYVADQHNHRIRLISPIGTITTVAGNGSPGYSGDGGDASMAGLGFPCRVAVDAVGDVYFTDQFNHRVRKITVTTQVQGGGTAGGGVDIYPNPVIDYLHIATENNQYQQATVSTVAGSVVIEAQLQGASNNIQVSRLPPGNYLLTLYGNGRNAIYKFTKE